MNGYFDENGFHPEPEPVRQQSFTRVDITQLIDLPDMVLLAPATGEVERVKGGHIGRMIPGLLSPIP